MLKRTFALTSLHSRFLLLNIWKQPKFQLVYDSPGLWVGLYNRTTTTIGTWCFQLKFRIVSLLASWMRELSAAKLREFYVAKRNITVIQVDMLNMFATILNMSCTRFLRVLHIQLMLQLATILKPALSLIGTRIGSRSSLNIRMVSLYRNSQSCVRMRAIIHATLAYTRPATLRSL